jgi:hypothetical protein
VKRVHTGEKPYEWPCELCKKTFSDSSNLAVHKRVHTGEKPYECDNCKKTFSHSTALANHKRTHTGEKSYECEICKKTYSRNSDLKNHTRVHTGETPYSCDLCQKSYSSRSALSYHNKSSAHIERMKSKKVNISLMQSSFVDCGESIEEEDIKEEINEEESVDDALTNHQETENINICEDIKEEDKEEESVDDPLYFQEGETRSENIVTEVKEEGIGYDTLPVQEIHNSGDEENNTVVDEMDIVDHKFELIIDHVLIKKKLRFEFIWI